MDITTRTNTPWPEPASELYRSSDRRLSAKLGPTFEDRGCHVVSMTDPYGRDLGFQDRSRYFFFQVVHETEWTQFQTHYFSVKSSSVGNRTRTSRPVVKNSDHLPTEAVFSFLVDQSRRYCNTRPTRDSVIFQKSD
jgi:hypothetical protein